MSFTLRDENGRKIEIFNQLPEHLKRYYQKNAENIAAMGDFGEAVFHHYPGEGFSVWYSSYNAQHDSVLIGGANSEVLELHISLINQIEGTWEGIENASLPPYRFGLSFTPHVNTRAIFKADNHYETCDIHFEKWFLQRMSVDFPLLAEFMEKVEKNIPTDLTKHHFFCTMEMITAIRFIHNHRNSERRHKYMLECKVKEILIAALERAEEQLLPRKPLKLSVNDQESLREAKRLIELDVDEMPSLADLCKRTLLNEYKLKKGFKMLFGVSPYQYHVQLKMERAKFLLLNTEQTIVEIALTLGYQYDHNFSIEFKKYCGCTPSYFRKQNRK